MKTDNELRMLLRSIDHKGYPNYKQTAGSYHFNQFDLYIDHVQGIRLRLPQVCTLRCLMSKLSFRRHIIREIHN